MSFANVKTIYLKEMKESLRDRRTLISMIVVPVLLMPVLIIGIGGLSVKLIKQVQAEKAKVMILGSDHAPEVAGRIAKIERFQIVDYDPNFRELISDKKIRVAVEIPEAFQKRVEAGEQPEVPIYYYEGEIKSEAALRDIERAFTKYRDEWVRDRLQASQLSDKILKPFIPRETNVAPEEKVAGQRFGGLIPYMIILMCMTGAMYPAIDLTAGEKERGTIETILVSPAGRFEIVLGKFFTVLTASVATAALALGSMSLTLTLGLSYLSSQTEAKDLGMQFTLTPGSVMMVLVMMLPVTIFFASALLAIALIARGYKEAQSYISPLMIVVIIPAVASMLPGMELDLGLAFIPILSTSLVVKEILTQVYHWNLIGITFVVSAIYAGIALMMAFEMFRRENVLFRT